MSNLYFIIKKKDAKTANNDLEIEQNNQHFRFLKKYNIDS